MQSLAVAVLGTLSIGMLSAFFSPSKRVYGDLKRPSWAPPAWVFGPVWTLLYILMGVAAWLVWSKTMSWSPALTWYALQLALNAAWSPVFFRARAPRAALVILILLVVALIKTTYEFWKESPKAGALLLPYLTWSIYAGFLNYALVA